MTVLGGLQCKFVDEKVVEGARFNTDDGIRRAAIRAAAEAGREAIRSFNTDDGIRRAAILCP